MAIDEATRAPEATAAGPGRSQWVSDHLMELSGLVALIACLALFEILRPSIFLTSGNISVILSNASVAAVLAAGLSVSLSAGQFDLSIGETLALSGVVVAKLIDIGAPWWIAILGAVVAASLVGVINGILTVRGGVPSIVATLGMQSVLLGVLVWATNDAYIQILPQGLPKFGRSSVAGIPDIAIVMLALCVAGALAMRYTTAGRNLQAVGRNPEAARLAGINVGGYVLGSLVCTAAFAGIAGVLLAANLSGGHPEVGPGYVLPAFAAAFLGAAAHRTGTFTFIGGLYGAILITAVTNGLVVANAADWTANVVTGLVLIGAVVLSRVARRRSLAHRR
ncbi:MAG TPA: ABC transporter permease [Solirubrobacteraceae bacterium]|jgi:ribose transport system permease protein|nr:ABC transporter permease [Solirubrobacteraceae bacterium]